MEMTSPPLSSLPSLRSVLKNNLCGVIAHPQQQVTLTCYISPSRVGAVIGRRGATILQIQREASVGSGAVRVSVVSDGSEEADWTPVLIRGDPVGVFAAARLLVPLVEKDGMDEHVVLDVPIPRAKHSAIVGRKGLTIAALSADTHVRIMVPHRTPQTAAAATANQPLFAPNTTEPPKTAPIKTKTSLPNINIVQLEGPLQNVENCLVNILSLFIPSSSSSATKPITTDEEPLENDQEQLLAVPQHSVTLGKGRNSAKPTNTPPPVSRQKKSGSPQQPQQLTATANTDTLKSLLPLADQQQTTLDITTTDQEEKGGDADTADKDIKAPPLVKRRPQAGGRGGGKLKSGNKKRGKGRADVAPVTSGTN